MTVDEMREKVKEAYNGDRWKRKVQYMSDDQIIAIFYRLKSKGQIK